MSSAKRSTGTLRPKKIYQIISGERRYRAALRAKLTEILCWVQTPREEEILVRQIVENRHGADRIDAGSDHLMPHRLKDRRDIATISMSIGPNACSSNPNMPCARTVIIGIPLVTTWLLKGSW